jgi:hypothetical protein
LNCEYVFGAERSETLFDVMVAPGALFMAIFRVMRFMMTKMKKITVFHLLLISAKTVIVDDCGDLSFKGNL